MSDGKVKKSETKSKLEDSNRDHNPADAGLLFKTSLEIDKNVASKLLRVCYH